MPTNLDKATLQALWVNGFTPQGTDFANLINSQVNVAETSAQRMLGPLSMTKLVTPLVSSDTAFSGGITVSGDSTFTGQLVVSGFSIFNDDISIGGGVTVSADSTFQSTITCSALKTSKIAIISAAGTTQATAANITATMNRLQGITDGQTTGFKLLGNRAGLIQYIVNESNTSANLWPPTGGIINNLGANVVFPIAAGTSYTVFHTRASAYGVR